MAIKEQSKPKSSARELSMNVAILVALGLTFGAAALIALVLDLVFRLM